MSVATCIRLYARSEALAGRADRSAECNGVRRLHLGWKRLRNFDARTCHNTSTPHHIYTPHRELSCQHPHPQPTVSSVGTRTVTRTHHNLRLRPRASQISSSRLSIVSIVSDPRPCSKPAACSTATWREYIHAQLYTCPHQNRCLVTLANRCHPAKASSEVGKVSIRL